MNRKSAILMGGFALSYFLCVGLGVFLNQFFDQNGNMFYAPAFAALLAGFVYLFFISKLKTFGLISLLGLMMGLFFFASGHMAAAFLPAVVFALLADITAAAGRYENKVVNGLSFILFSFVNSGPILLMWLLPQVYRASLAARGKSAEYIHRVMIDYKPQIFVFFILTIVIAALIGVLIGYILLENLQKRKQSF